MNVHRAYTLLILIGCLIPGLIQSQKLVFCDWVRPEGKPMQVYAAAEIERYGRFIFLHYTSDTLLSNSTNYFFIDRQVEGKWVAEDLVSEDSELGEKAIWHLYHFRKPGNYRITVLNQRLDSLTSAKIELILPDHELGTKYYSACEVLTSTTMEEMEEEHFSAQFELTENGKKSPKASFRVLLTQDEPFSIEKLKVDLWQKDPESGKFEHYFGESTYKLDPNWADFHFSFEIEKPGNYRMMIFTGSGVFIAMKDVEVLPLPLEGGL